MGIKTVISRPVALITLFTLVVSLIFACSQPVDSARTSTVAFKPASTDGIALGTNLNGVSDWSTQLPFLDGFKSARPWMPQCSSKAPCDKWETQEANLLDLDEHGWVKSLPAPEDAPEYTQVGTLLHREIDRYPGGKYVVLYEGEGTIEYNYDAQKDEAASKPGRDLINVTPSGAGIYLTITATDPNRTGNYIRNIHVVPIEYENTYTTEIFNPLFLERINKFGAIRFMDWMATNNSEQSTWENRPKVEDATYTKKGVPLEIMIELANRLQANPWFNMPHKATDEYMANFAQMVKERLDPNLKVYVELSNEIWNWMFTQSHYALEQGKSRWGEDKGDAFVQWYGMRVAQMSDIWKRTFGNQRDRVISVMATQTAWQGLENSVLDCPLWVAEGNRPCYQHDIDVYAITGYFSGNLGSEKNQSTVESWLKDADGGFNRAFTQLKQGSVLAEQTGDDSLVGAANIFKYHQQVAQQKGLQLVAYEGGQHLVNPNSDKLTEFFIALNRRPEMYDLYSQLLESWQQAGGTLFMNFSDIGTPSKWGSWGALEHVDQEKSPKYDALINFIQKHQLR
jgi:hypothetical protein